MKIYHNKIFLLLLPACLFLNDAQGQNIRGDTIYIDINKVVAVAFPSPPGKAELLANGSEERLYEVNDMGGNSLSILALKKGAQNQDLEVTEGGRKHLFILSFREGSPARSIDLSTKRKLADRSAIVKKNVSKALTEADGLYKQAKNNLTDEVLWERIEAMYSGLAKVIDPKDGNIVKLRLEEIHKQLQVIDVDKKYRQALEDGNNYLRSKRYADAREAYLKALEYHHEDASAKKWIRLTDSTETKDYVDKGDAAVKAKNYVLAKTYYQKALNIMPAYPSLQDRINQVKPSADPQIYKIERKNGDEALKVNDIEEAKRAYNAALSVKPGDAYIIAQVKKVEIEEQKIEQEGKQEAEYQSILASAKDLADKASDAQGYDLAIKEYQRASTKIPGRVFPGKRIKELAKLKEMAKAH